MFALGADAMTAAQLKQPDIFSLNQYDNPLIRFYLSRGAVAMNLGGAVVEATSGVNALPYDEVDNPIDLLKHVTTSALPFAIQGMMEGQALPATGIGFLGVRVAHSKYDAATARIFNDDRIYQSLEYHEKFLIREATDLPTTSKYSEKSAKLEKQRRADLRADPKDEFNIGQKYKNLRAGIREGLDIDFGEDGDLKSRDPNDRALAEYWAVTDDPRFTRIRKSDTTARSRMFNFLVDERSRLWTVEQRESVLRNTNVRPMPIEALRVMSKARRRDFEKSLNARLRYYNEMGRPDLAALASRLFRLQEESIGTR
jgi:hypothetical protein